MSFPLFPAPANHTAARLVTGMSGGSALSSLKFLTDRYKTAACGIRALLADRRRIGEDELRDRIERGQAEGDVPASADARHLAAFYTAILQGMSITARDGARRAELDRIATTAMDCWPP
ncbi:hypothetical protein OIU35_19845 [Boseaceae bacterium BT-24-1]|nr:hypothetical protein [Boseaceae bacterium BT-24-1]